MSFKIKGIASGSSKGPYKKGEIIPLSPNEKLIAQAIEEVGKLADAGFLNLTIDAITEGESSVITGKGLKYKDPSQYLGTVKVTYRPLELSNDRIHPESIKRVKLQIVDTTDDLGVDDLKTISVEVI